MISRALNQKTAPHLSYVDFLGLAQRSGCVGVEPRNDLGRPLFDGLLPSEAGTIARSMGLRLIGMCEIYPFYDWSDERAKAVEALISAAVASGAETISLIPRVDGVDTEEGVRQATLRAAMWEIMPMLEGRNILALIEPVGFASSSLRDNGELVEAIEAVGGPTKFKLVHDTFQYSIAGGGSIFPEYTATVHLSGISDPTPALDERLDAVRVFIDEGDRCGMIRQIEAFLDGGYEGPFSMECTSSAVQCSDNLERDLVRSFKFIEEQLF